MEAQLLGASFHRPKVMGLISDLGAFEKATN